MMANVITTTLKSSLDIIILIGAVTGFLWSLGRTRSLRSLRIAAMIAPAGAIPFSYLVRPDLDRQAYDLVVSIVSASAMALLLALIWIRAIAARNTGSQKMTNEPKSRFNGWLTAALTVAAFFGPLSDLALVPAGFVAPQADYLTTDVIGAVTAFGLVLALGAGLAAAIGGMIRKFSPVSAAAWVTLGLLPLIVVATTATVQMLIVGGRIAVTPSIFGLVARLINSRQLLQNMALAAVALPAVFAVIKRGRAQTPVVQLNPAQKRLLKAGRRGELLGVTALLSLIVVAAFFMRADKVFAERQVELDPAKRIDIVGGTVRLPVKEIKDQKLHRFSVIKDGTNIRFIAVYKGSGVYATGLDACENCGPAGYYEKDGNIVCKNCEAYIPADTLGLPGGCNPIPLNSTVSAGSLIIRQVDLAGNSGGRR